MKRKKTGFTLIELAVVPAVLAALVGLIAGCGGGGGDKSDLPSFTYIPIADVPQTVNDLGKRICQEQRNVVTPGGTVWAPGFTYDDQVEFENSGKLTQIVNEVKASRVFKIGVDSIRTLSVTHQARVFVAYSTPLYPTWAMNGHIGPDGTTDAGYAVEKEIATALTNAVKEAL